MGFLQIKKVTVNIGIKNEFKIVQFSDTHAISLNPRNGKKAIDVEKAWYDVRVDFANHFKEKITEKQMIPSAKCLHKLVNYANKSDADVVILCGDIIDYYSKYNYRLLEKETKRITKPYIFSCGNHESPASQYEKLFNQIEYGIYEFDNVKIISLDNSNNKFSQNQYEFLLTQLNSTKPIILVMHEPIVTRRNKKKMSVFDDYYTIKYDSNDKYSLQTIDLIYKNDIFKLILCGHVHGYHKSMFAKNRYQICSSSGLIGKVNKITVK